jgi:hypothetical protein
MLPTVAPKTLAPPKLYTTMLPTVTPKTLD